MCRIPEPHEIADAYYARQEEAWERLIKHATCADCLNYTEAPDKWVNTPCGWCSVDDDFIEGDESVRKLGCESFEPNGSYVPCEDEREYAREDQGCCSRIARAAGLNCMEIPGCFDCTDAVLNRIADMIEAEQAKPQLPEGVEWPRFEDGQPVKIGDEFLNSKGNTATVTRIALSEKHFTINKGQGRICKTYDNRIKRPEPEVLDADGGPIKVGDTVWYLPWKEGRSYFVDSIHGGIVELRHEMGGWSGVGSVDPKDITHRKPDTQEAIYDDSTMPPYEYLTIRAGFTTEQANELDLSEITQTMICHLLDRQRKLMGGE